MTLTLNQTIDKVLSRLEDTTSAIWSRSEIEEYLENGYDQMTRQTKCLWDMSFVAEDVVYCGNHNYVWEEDYMGDAGYIIHNIFNFTGGSSTGSPIQWEQQYQDNGIGPCNHTNLWESSYTSTDIFSATAKLPADTIEVDRVTYDNYRIEPQFSKDLAEHYKSYEYIQGPQRGYTLDKDGYFTIRKVPAPSVAGDSYTVSGTTYGVLRSQTASDFETSPSIIGSRGILRRVSGQFPAGNTKGYGLPRRAFKDGKNVRVEIHRRGADPSIGWEVPDRYLKYIELYAMYMARERDGAGQNKAVAAHFLERYNEGIARLLNRKQRVLKERVNKMGGGGRQNGWPGLAKLPYHYDSQVTR